MSDTATVGSAVPIKVAIVFGTRPEAIKLAPVVLRLREEPAVETVTVNTGQHREMARQAFAAFDLSADVDLDVMVAGQTLGELTGRLFNELDALFERERPDWVLVQGDTTTAMVAATTAFYRHIRVGHVEAGLRTFQRLAPFPEEINRTFIGHVATLHFAPTESAKANLRSAGVRESEIRVTGNTAIDAVEMLRPSLSSRPLDFGVSATELAGRRLLLVTSHRRESFGPGLEGICRAILELVQRYDDVMVVYPVHLNPNVQTMVHALLGGEPRVRLLPPLAYLDLMALVARATLVLSDSGGLQEEVPSFGKPILILRDVTERPEVLSVGAGRLVGTNTDTIVANVMELFENEVAYLRMASAGNPFGDGTAARKIVAALKQASVEHA